MRAVARLKRELKLFRERLEQHRIVGSEINRGGGTGVEVNLLLLAHALEKGMGLPNPRPKFGYEKAVSLLELLEKYHDSGKDEHRYAYVEGLNVLGSYISFTDNDISSLEVKFKALARNVEQKHSGVDIVNMDRIYYGLNLEQDQYFIRSRHSIRSYENRSVDTDH